MSKNEVDLNLIYGASSEQPVPAPKGFFKKLLAMMAGKFGMSLLCTAIITFITSSTTLWGWFKVACALIGLIGDEKVTKIVHDVADKAAPVIHPASGEHKAPLKEKIDDLVKGKAGEVVKDAAHKVTEPVKAAVADGKEEVKKVGDKVEGAADKVAEKLGGMKEQYATKAQAKAAHKAAQKEAADRQKLMIRAAALGVKCDPGMPLVDLSIKVQEAEGEKKDAYLEWWTHHGPNGRCPGCGFPMRVPPRGDGRYACPKVACGMNSASSQIRRMGAPPPSPRPPAEFEVQWKRWKDEQAKKRATASKSQMEGDSK